MRKRTTIALFSGILLILFFYFYRKSGKFRESIIAAFLFVTVLFSEPLQSTAKEADAFTSQPQMERTNRNRSFFSRARGKNGPGKPDGSGSGGDDGDDGIPQWPIPEPVEKTEERVENIDRSIRKMEEMAESDNESEEELCDEDTEQLFQVQESYKSNSTLKKITEKVEKNVSVLNDVENIKKALAKGEDPMSFDTTNLGNDFYYIRKPDARIIVKLDRTTGNSDIVAVGIRTNKKVMSKFAKIVNSQFDTKIKINPKAY